MLYGKRKANVTQRDWQQALQEGRVLRAYGGLTFTAYPTLAEATAAWLALVNDDTAELVQVEEQPPN
jgi:hypothetical protein